MKKIILLFLFTITFVCASDIVPYNMHYPLITYVFIISFILIFLLYKQYMLKNHIKDYHELLDSTIEALLLIKDEKIIDANKRAIKIFKLQSINELLGSNIFDHIPDESIDLVKKMTELEYEDPYEIILYDKEDRKFTALVKGSVLKNRNIRLTSIIDISKNKEKDKLLMEQSKLAAMGEMIGNIAHQWRQPLHVISTTTSSIKLQKELDILDDEFFFKSCDMINKNIMFLSNTIDDFRNYMNDTRVKNKFYIDNMINSFFTLTDSSITNNEIIIVKNIQNNLIVDGYKNELIQCMLNIFNNAVDALIQNNIKKKYIFISVKRIDNYINIYIKDNANGIPENIIDKIFEPYFTTKHQSRGTGLGLNMTYKLIVEGMNGDINVKNEKYFYNNKVYTGASFTIKILDK